MKSLITSYDWVRVIVMVFISGYLIYQIYIKTEMLLKWEMGITELAVDSDIMKFPSITFCPGSQNQELRIVDNITTDYKNLPDAEDMLIEMSQQISINE